MQRYECRYKDRLGADKSETIVADNARLAAEECQRLHPGCIMLTFPKPVIAESPSLKHFSLLGVGLIISGILAIAVISAWRGVSERGDSGAHNEVKNSETNELYSSIYPEVLKVSTPRGVATGFRVKEDEKVYLYTCRHCISSVEPIEVTDGKGRSLIMRLQA